MFVFRKSSYLLIFRFVTELVKFRKYKRKKSLLQTPTEPELFKTTQHIEQCLQTVHCKVFSVCKSGFLNVVVRETLGFGYNVFLGVLSPCLTFAQTKLLLTDRHIVKTNTASNPS